MTWKVTGHERKGNPVGVWEPTAGRQRTRRERQLFEPTEFTLPVDFHSWRRAYAQTLAEADVNAQQATALTGHASGSVHARYLRNGGQDAPPSPAALPVLDISRVQSDRPSVLNTPELSGETGRYQCERASEKRQPVQGNLPLGPRALAM